MGLVDQRFGNPFADLPQGLTSPINPTIPTPKYWYRCQESTKYLYPHIRTSRGCLSFTFFLIHRLFIYREFPIAGFYSDSFLSLAVSDPSDSGARRSVSCIH
jgi:hypothetical protein